MEIFVRIRIGNDANSIANGQIVVKILARQGFTSISDYIAEI